ncbi:MAG: hypothetical protein A2787_04165 [Omnitrophica WOR_2 bacterium RIFCSPHIGHO2_01_FULL_48_9]|nr:MAG: hypothetical protein A3D10_07435 [Omnitrophica WOR_2 bacterium RIFCSPHIGHO2_02_FULL_48_11]OGX34179.1 MAG: hypothetical protein A2787_04165 [Omnitrophica WOR_2 bacterium RIFCSPHIGHO2_01_FULL_48_9]
MPVPIFPTINASLNGLAAIFLFLGWRAIRAKDQRLHKKYMVAALTASALFLCSYVTYHVLVQGVTKYQHEGILRVIYFFILLTHTPLAMIILPFSILAVRHAVKKNFVKHTRITRWLLPVWMYVSVTGVLIYLMLYIF